MYTMKSLAALLSLLAPALAPAATVVEFDADHAALVYHKAASQHLDLRAAARTLQAYQFAPNFDKPEVLERLLGELEAEFEQVDPAQEFRIEITRDQVKEYDHERGEFSVGMFEQGSYVPFSAFGQHYMMVMANAEGSRAIRMPREEARALDETLRATGRQVRTEIHFRIIGSGDPAGAVQARRGSNQHVVRAEVLAARLLEPRSGRPLHTLAVVPVGQEPAATAAPARPAIPPLSAANAEIGGLRVGVPAATLKQLLESVYGPVQQRSAPQDTDPRIVAQLELDPLACRGLPGRQNHAGTVCVTALVDKDDVVRAIKVERLFPRIEFEALRTALVARYGATVSGEPGELAWGPVVEPRLLVRRPGEHALTATVIPVRSGTAGSAAQLHNVQLVLADAAWANGGR